MGKFVLLKLALVFLLFLIGEEGSYAQTETQENIDNANALLQGRSASLDKYLARSGGIQQRLLRKLQRKEQRMLKRLAAKDSAFYYEYLQRGVSYDSIAALSTDTVYRQRFAAQPNATIDSLKGLQSFISSQQDKLITVPGAAGNTPPPITQRIKLPTAAAKCTKGHRPANTTKDAIA